MQTLSATEDCNYGNCLRVNITFSNSYHNQGILVILVPQGKSRNFVYFLLRQIESVIGSFLLTQVPVGYYQVLVYDMEVNGFVNSGLPARVVTGHITQGK